MHAGNKSKSLKNEDTCKPFSLGIVCRLARGTWIKKRLSKNRENLLLTVVHTVVQRQVAQQVDKQVVVSET